MAVLHRATLTPGKAELVASWLDSLTWGGSGPVELSGSYRFDDPAGEVGVEAFLVRRGDLLLHVPVTYRGAPLPGADAGLIGRTQHSVLGERWVYAAGADPVAIACFQRALRGEQEQAPIEVWDGNALLERREPTVRLRVEGRAADPASGVHLVDVLDGSDVAGDARARLVAVMADGDVAVVVAVET